MSEPMWCDGCRAVGAVHCAHPDECGNMLSATSAADQWKAWLDDLPLPFTFDPAIGRLQDFITALTTRIDVPQPNPVAPAALAEAPEVQAMIREAYATARQMISVWGNDDGPDLLGQPDTDYGRGWLDAISYAQSQIRTLEAAALKGETT